jgi:hypothetical protein
MRELEQDGAGTAGKQDGFGRGILDTESHAAILAPAYEMQEMAQDGQPRPAPFRGCDTLNSCISYRAGHRGVPNAGDREGTADLKPPDEALANEALESGE